MADFKALRAALAALAYPDAWHAAGRFVRSPADFPVADAAATARAPGEGEARAAFIAAFDPPTVRELLDATEYGSLTVPDLVTLARRGPQRRLDLRIEPGMVSVITPWRTFYVTPELVADGPAARAALARMMDPARLADA